MVQVFKLLLFAVLIAASGLLETAHGQGNRAQQEQAAERARQAQAQAAAAAARDREREAQARRAREQSPSTSGRQQLPAAIDNRRPSNYPSSVPIERVRFESEPRPGSSLSQATSKPVPPGTTFTSNGIGKPVRPPTAAEAKRGFTGRVTDDGRALVKFQGRIYAVPASRIGVSTLRSDGNRPASVPSWTEQKQKTLTADIQRLVAGTPGTVTPASVQLTARSRTNLARAFRTIGRLSPGRNNSVFWSGHAVNDDRIRAAATWARSNGGKTLEALLDEGGLKLPKYDQSDPSTVAAWEIASEEFAKSASGKVRVLAVGSPYAGSVWERVEFPALKMNQEVTEIWSVDPRTGTEEILWER